MWKCARMAKELPLLQPYPLLNLQPTEANQSAAPLIIECPLECRADNFGLL